MKRLLALTCALLLCAAGAVSQGVYPGNSLQDQRMHKNGGMFYALGYYGWQAVILSGNTATGSQTIIIYPQGATSGCVTLRDGSCIPLTSVFNTATPITITDAGTETVTPTAVSISTCPVGNLGVGSGALCANVTASFSNTHGQSAAVGSGDWGIEEAITDAGAQGGGLVYWIVDTGNVTLTTTGLTTTTTTKVPSTFYGVGAAAIVETTITTSANWAVGITSHTASFCSANSTLTAGTTCIANQAAPATVGSTTALTAILFTMGTSNPGAGAVKARVWGLTPVQPAS